MAVVSLFTFALLTDGRSAGLALRVCIPASCFFKQAVRDKNLKVDVRGFPN